MELIHRILDEYERTTGIEVAECVIVRACAY